MKQAYFRFYAELNDFLPPESPWQGGWAPPAQRPCSIPNGNTVNRVLPKRRGVEFSCPFDGRQSVKNLIEALGTPHTEVDLVLINGRSASFSDFVEDGDRISVYPVFEGLDIAPVTRVRPHPLRQTRFVADAHLGRLGGYLRMLGFDTLYRNDFGDRQLSAISSAERRILLTRDRGLLKRRAVTHGYCVRESAPRLQLVEVLRRFDLAGSISPFTRCIRCNGLLEKVDKEQILDAVPPKSRLHADRFQRCRECRQVYWSGSHYRRMERFLEQVMASLRFGSGQ